MLTTARITDEDLASMARELAARLNRLALIPDDLRQQPPPQPAMPDAEHRPEPR